MIIEMLDFNVLCATFIGLSEKGGSYENSYEVMSFFPELGYTRHFSELEFHSDWNWLMRVVEAIENLDLSKRGYSWEDEGVIRYNNIGTRVEIEGGECIIYEWRELDPAHFYARCKGDTKLEATVKAVKEFLIWYYKDSNDVYKL